MKDRKVKALLVEKGIKQVAIARSLGVSASTVCKIVSGTARSRRVEKAIEDILREHGGKA